MDQGFLAGIMRSYVWSTFIRDLILTNIQAGAPLQMEGMLKAADDLIAEWDKRFLHHDEDDEEGDG